MAVDRRERLLGGSGARILLVPPILLIAIGLVVPILAIIIETVANLGPTGVITEPLSRQAFTDGIITTVLLAVFTTLVALGIGLVYGLAMAVVSTGMARILIGVLLLTFWISLLVRTYGWLLTLQPNGALDALAGRNVGLFHTLPGLVLPMVHILLPYMVLPIYAAAQEIDPAQLRAARSLGASSTMALRTVVLPALRSGVMAGIVLVFILSLGFYVTPAFLGAPDDRVIAIAIGEVFGVQGDMALASTMGLLVLIIVLAIYFVADRTLRISEQWERF